MPPWKENVQVQLLFPRRRLENFSRSADDLLIRTHSKKYGPKPGAKIADCGLNAIGDEGEVARHDMITIFTSKSGSRHARRPGAQRATALTAGKLSWRLSRLAECARAPVAIILTVLFHGKSHTAREYDPATDVVDL